MNESKGLKILIGVLLVCVISLSGYIVYYKFFDKSNVTNQLDNNKENNNHDDKKDEVVNTENDEDKDKLLQCETSLDGKKYKYYVVSKYEEYILKITDEKGDILYTFKYSDIFDLENNYFGKKVKCNDLDLTMTKLNSIDKDKVYFKMHIYEGFGEKIYYIKNNTFTQILDLDDVYGYNGTIDEFYNKNTKETVSNVRIQNGDLYAIMFVDNSVIEYKYVFKDGSYSREKVSTNAYTYDKELYADM